MGNIIFSWLLIKQEVLCKTGLNQSKPVLSGQNLADSAGNPWGLWLLVEGIHGEIWVVSEHFNSPKNDINSSLEYFHITGTLCMSLNCIWNYLREV